MSKSLLAFVWIAGPLSGTLVQPYVGIRSDNCRSPWGRRVPFMLAGAFATAMSLLCLAWVGHFSDFSLLVQDCISSREICCMSKLIFHPFHSPGVMKMLTPKCGRQGKLCTDFLDFSAQIQSRMVSKSVPSSSRSSGSTYWILQSTQVNCGVLFR